MPNKWASFKGKLEPWKPEPSYQELVDEAKGEYIGLSPTEVAKEFNFQDNVKEFHEKRIKLVNVKLEALSQLLVSALEGSGQESFRLESGMSVGLRIDPSVTVLPDKTDEYDEWLHSEDIEKLLTLNANTRTSYVKNLLELGEPAPEWAKVYLKTTARLYGKKKEAGNGE